VVHAKVHFWYTIELKTKTQSKIDLVSEFIANNISKIEAFVMVKNPQIVLNLKTK
jgi:hypothetical protein